MDYQSIIDFIKEDYGTNDFIPLHAPVFSGREKEYLNECIDSTFVSSVGKYVDRFEEAVKEFTGAEKAVAVVNGTNALMVALRLSGVEAGTEVLTQALTFVATCNSIMYLAAEPVFIDVDRDTMGLSPDSLNHFFSKNAEMRGGAAYNKKTGKRISACLPMHTFGHPARIDEIAEICRQWNVPLVEDAAESLGSYINGEHTGLKGKVGVLSFNGNKTITTGGGGMIITNDKDLGEKAKYLTTTAKKPHPYEYFHDELGYNFRMPNINAALGCAQLEKLPEILKIKRERALRYLEFFKHSSSPVFVSERVGTKVNYWLNSLIFGNREERDRFLKNSNDSGVMTRPIWTLMSRLPMYSSCFTEPLVNSEWLEERLVNIPSGVGY